MRLDVYLSQYYPEITRSQLQIFIKNGRVTVNGVAEYKSGLKLGEDDVVLLDTRPFKNDSLPENLVISVIYEDTDLVVIEKPAGMLTHSKGSFNPEETVASWLSKQSDVSFSDQTNRDGIVHRLDRSTSGVMVCAKNDSTLKHLQKQFQDRKVQKVYSAIVEGELKPSMAEIDLPIERNPKQPQRFRVGAGGKSAQTTYEVEKFSNGISLVKLLPKTGRTHQIRVHLAYVNHPILGDKFYGGADAERLFLHARSLQFKMPNGQLKKFDSNLPADFLKKL